MNPRPFVCLKTYQEAGLGKQQKPRNTSMWMKTKSCIVSNTKGNPRNNDTYSMFDPTETYPTETYAGLYSILTFGYPAGGNGGLTDDQARYATANAIRYWLAEQQAKHGMDFQQYNFSQLARNRARAKQRRRHCTENVGVLYGPGKQSA